MLSGLHKREQKSFAPESSKNTDTQSEANSSWKETSDDIITAGSKKFMGHQERYEFVKNRTYSPVKPSQTRD